MSEVRLQVKHVSKNFGITKALKMCHLMSIKVRFTH